MTEPDEINLSAHEMLEIASLGGNGSEYVDFASLIDQSVNEYKAALARIRTLEQALRYYADKDNYKERYVAEDCGCCSYWHHAKIGKDGDEGETARAALEASHD